MGDALIHVSYQREEGSMTYRDDLSAAIRRADSLEADLSNARARVSELENEVEELRAAKHIKEKALETDEESTQHSYTDESSPSTAWATLMVLLVFFLAVALTIGSDSCMFS